MDEVKLLALPEWCLDDDRARYVLEGMTGPQFRNDMEAYARANVESSVAELRAEVTRLHIAVLDLEKQRSDLIGEAERLAEALRGACGDLSSYGHHASSGRWQAALTTTAQPGETG